MTYSAAWFGNDPSPSLEAAQHAKYARILDHLQARPGQRVLEIGCGWGGFAEAAARRGVEVHGITISRAQLEFARARLAAAGLSERARLSFVDYRDVTGTYDHVVSIEMVEAVGERYWPAYFRAIRDRLAPGGRALIQAITIDGTAWPRYRSGTDFIQRHVFPGGMLPSVEVLREQASAAGLVERGCTGFGLDYAETLRRWLGAFSAAEPKVRELGFDERFLRLWRFYLAYCEAGFAHGRTDVVHFELARPQ
jgi:cyclopropane-fatty-acyl-phospholipid synthase